MRMAGLPVTTVFWWTAGVLAAFRFWLAIALPITGDEAYFYWWGIYPDWGFYDHPPMVGWWLTALLPVSHAIGWLRLPAILLPYVAAWLAWQLTVTLSPDKQRAWWAALIVLLAPAHVWNILITTDTPMVFFAMLSIIGYLRGISRNNEENTNPAWLIMAGLALSMALMSKYFAVFLAIAYLADTTLIRRDSNRWRDLALLVAFSLPGPMINAWWNSTHCWDNILFNVFNRNNNESVGSFKNPIFYVATIAYLLGPYALWAAWRGRDGLLALWKQGGPGRSMLCIAAAPLGLFALLSLFRTVGLHWPLAYIPIALTIIVITIPANLLPRMAAWAIGLALAHVVLFVALLAAPISLAKGTRYFGGLVMAFHAQQVIAPLKALENDNETFTLANDGYSNGSIIGYEAGRYMAVFGPGSLHARQDDILTDWRELDGKNIAIYLKTDFTLDEFAPYFDSIKVEETDIEGVKFSLIKGYSFNYPAYREGVLRGIRDRWYRLPSWLPNRGCYFCDRYFPDEAIPVKQETDR